MNTTVIFKNEIIAVWMIVYDGDVNQVYTTTNFDKACASIESSIRGYMGDESPAAEKIYSQIMDKVRSSGDMQCVPMKFDKLEIVIYRWEIDKFNPLHQILSKCYDIVDDNLQKEISFLFSKSVI